jgi:hypothetical protein
MYFGPEHASVDGAVNERERLSAGASFTGPAVIERFGDAVVFLPGHKAGSMSSTTS